MDSRGFNRDHRNGNLFLIFDKMEIVRIWDDKKKIQIVAFLGLRKG